jgi:ribosomal protein S18 acetylase RimI-like enzyme
VRGEAEEQAEGGGGAGIDSRDLRAGTDDGSPSIIIRPFAPGDSAAMAAIWEDGLLQTVDSTGGLMSTIMRPTMARLERSATAPGANLAVHWHSHNGRRMVVSAMGDSDVVVGCCRVMRGMDEKKSAPAGCDVCSMWHVSTAENARRRGVATALMNAAEDWARMEGVGHALPSCGF